eukprot:g262.t1
MAVTGNSDFDWFLPPRTAMERQLHMKLLSLGRGNFLQLCFSNSKASFPGGSLRCLQLIGFWLSWARRLYCKDECLRVSDDLLNRLKEWSEEKRKCEEKVDNDDDRNSEGSKKKGEEESEWKLAEKLYEDFKRFPILYADDKSNEFMELSVDDETANDMKNSSMKSNMKVEENETTNDLKNSSVQLEKNESVNVEKKVQKHVEEVKTNQNQGKEEVAVDEVAEYVEKHAQKIATLILGRSNQSNEKVEKVVNDDEFDCEIDSDLLGGGETTSSRKAKVESLQSSQQVKLRLKKFKKKKPPKEKKKKFKLRGGFG